MTGTPRKGRPPRTSRAQILDGARAVIDRDGWPSLTIRRLASEVGVSPMTLYHHVRDREDLLVQLINDEVGRFPHPQLPSEPAERIVAAMAAVREVLRDRPWVAEVVTTDGFLSRVGESTAWYVDVILGAAADAGCDTDEAILLFRDLWYYTVGEVLVRAKTKARRSDEGSPTSPQGGMFDRPDPAIGTQHASSLKHLARAGQRWETVAEADTYVRGLRQFVRGILRADEEP